VGERASQRVSNGGNESNTSGKEGRDTKGVSRNKCDIDIGSVRVREKTEREIESEGEREKGEAFNEGRGEDVWDQIWQINRKSLNVASH
jgi:hypothetical protein